MGQASDDTPERRRAVRITLIGAARFGSKQAQRAISAVLDNANRVGGGFHARESLDVGEHVTVCFAFLDQNEKDQQEKLGGRVAWVKSWEKGHLIGVVWEQMIVKERNPWLASYLDYSLEQTA